MAADLSGLKFGSATPFRELLAQYYKKKEAFLRKMPRASLLVKWGKSVMSKAFPIK